MAKRAQSTANVSQIAQIITNLEHFEISCAELERSLTNIRSVFRSSLYLLLRTWGFIGALLGVRRRRPVGLLGDGGGAASCLYQLMGGDCEVSLRSAPDL